MDFSKAFSSIRNLRDGTSKITRTVSYDEYGLQFEEAPNEIEFIHGEKFLNLESKLFPIQKIIVRDFFELLCPKCNDVEKIYALEKQYETELAQNKDKVAADNILLNPVLSNQVLFEYNVCPKCNLKKVTIHEQLKNHNELIGVMGMRSGKSLLASCIATAYLHKLLCIKDLQRKLSIMKKQVLDISFIATSERQVAATVYGQFKNLYKSSPWFTNLKKQLKNIEKKDFAQGDLYLEKRDQVWFKFADIRVEAQHSNSDSLAGRTRILAVIDELARFDDVTQSKRSAEEVYRTIKHSLTTVDSATKRAYEDRKEVLPNVALICITSPIHNEDKSMQLLKEAKKNPRIFSMHKATWEANPNIRQDDLKSEFSQDPIGAERDFGANPPGALQPFIEDSRLIDLCVDSNRYNGIITREVRFVHEIEGNIFNYIKASLLDVKYNTLCSYVMHCDPGKNRDSFCIAMGHLMGGDKVIIDGCVEIRPITRGNNEGLQPHAVYFPSVVDLIFEIHRRVRLKFVTYDRWNSADQIDRLRMAGIPAIGMNLDRDDHVKFGESVRMQRISLPRAESDADPRANRGMPCSKALLELRTLNDNGKKVDHLPNGSNDMIQCYVGIHRLLKTPEKLKIMKSLANYRPVSKPGGVGRVIRLTKFR